MKLQNTIVSALMLLLYMGVLLHNTIPHQHIALSAESAVTHHHHQDNHDHHSHDTKEPQDLSDLSSLIQHVNMGEYHLTDINHAVIYFLAHPIILLMLLLFSSLWCLLFFYRIRPPSIPDKLIQQLCLTATSRRGPPSFSYIR